MKNSKVLSLLTAGALVVSSFSGLAMNGGVARAGAGDGALTAGTGVVEILAGSDTLDGLYFVDTTNASTDSTVKRLSIAAATAGVKVATTYAGAKAATAVIPATAGNAIGTGNIGAWKAATGTSKDMGIEWAASAVGIDYLGVDDDTTGTAGVASAVVYAPSTLDKLMTVSGGTVNASGEIEVTAGDKLVFGMNSNLATALTDMAKTGQISWIEGNASAGNSIYIADATNRTTATVTTLTSVTVKLDADAKNGDTDTIEFKVGAKSIAKVTVKVADPTPSTTDYVPFAVFTATDAEGNHYEDGKKVIEVQVPATAASLNMTDIEYAEYVNQIAKKTVTVNALWTTSEKEREAVSNKTTFTVTQDNKYKYESDSDKTPGNILLDTNTKLNEVTTSPLTSTAGASSFGMTFDAENANLKNTLASKKSATGLMKVEATTVVNGTTYRQTMTLSLKIKAQDTVVGAKLEPASSVTKFDPVGTVFQTEQKVPSAILDSAYYGLTLADGETGTAEVKWAFDNTYGSVTEDNMKFEWKFVEKTRDTAGAANGAWKDDAGANKIFELSGTNESKVKITPNTYVIGGEYILRGTVKTAKDVVVGQAFIKVKLTAEAAETLNVAVDTSKLEKGYVEIPATKTEIAGVTAKVTRASGVDVTENVDYRILSYEDYVDGVRYNNLTTRTAESDITMSKGKLTVKHSVNPGAYVVVAVDKTMSNYAVDAEHLIQVKSATGLAVTGLNIDQDKVTITNLNSSKIVVATVLPAVYQSNGYTTVAAKSAEVDAVAYSVADPSIVKVVNLGPDIYMNNENRKIDNTWRFQMEGTAVGSTTVTLTTLDGGFTQTIAVSVLGHEAEPTPEPEPEPEPEHKAGDAFTVDGVSVFVNADSKTLTVTDVAVVGKSATIPATVDGMDVTTIAAQAFKKSDAKTVYVMASITDIEKGAFKKAKTKKVYFYDPAALETVAKNAFKGANVKVVGVGGSFSESAASQLKKAGASKVKNNGSAK